MQNRERSTASARDSLTSFGLTASSEPRLQFPKPRSKSFSAVVHKVEQYARDESIIILFKGESGTGKTWLARYAHQHSSRSSHPLQEESLATISDSLAGSDLFGHVMGAFTDARAHRLGAFKSAIHSTLFLDELGKATPIVQRHLLRAIEERVIRPVGSDRSIIVDIRLMAATNVDLKSLVEKDLFLPDLYARLGHFSVYLPPLRERREDIPDLARYFLAQHAMRRGYPIGLPAIHPALMLALEEAEWETNLRGLDGAMHYLIAEADPSVELTLDHCSGDFDYLRTHARGRPKKSSSASVAAAIKQLGSVTDAARALSVSRSTIYRYAAKLKDDLPVPLVAESAPGD
jgi:two-component system response regulator HydG